MPHFPFNIGSWDTFLVVVMQGRSRFHPKYKKFLAMLCVLLVGSFQVAVVNSCLPNMLHHINRRIPAESFRSGYLALLHVLCLLCS